MEVVPQIFEGLAAAQSGLAHNSLCPLPLHTRRDLTSPLFRKKPNVNVRNVNVRVFASILNSDKIETRGPCVRIHTSTSLPVYSANHPNLHVPPGLIVIVVHIVEPITTNAM